jgi:hypothetical protein
VSFYQRKQPKGELTPAAEDAVRLAAEAVPAINEATGESWYEQYANAPDRAFVALCRLRRAEAGRGGTTTAGDDAVRRALAEADPEAVVWLASRAVSYLDEQGYPETLAPWLDE